VGRSVTAGSGGVRLDLEAGRAVAIHAGTRVSSTVRATGGRVAWTN
jgi:hypothetical protein